MVLVPFLLSIAVFTHLAVIDLALPAQQNEKLEKLTDNNLQLEVVIRPESIEVGDRIGGLIQRIPNVGGAPDVKTLSALIQGIKLKFPDKADATVLPEPNTSVRHAGAGDGRRARRPPGAGHAAWSRPTTSPTSRSATRRSGSSRAAPPWRR